MYFFNVNTGSLNAALHFKVTKAGLHHTPRLLHFIRLFPDYNSHSPLHARIKFTYPRLSSALAA